METAWLIFATLCAASCSIVTGFDLGPMIWTAQCQSECLREFQKKEGLHNIRVWRSRDKHLSECTKYCAQCHAEEGSDVCEDKEPKRISRRFLPDNFGYKIACEYCKTRELTENYEPSMLPAPEEKPIPMGQYDVAIVFQRRQQQWEFLDYYYDRAPIDKVYPCHWVIVVTADGPRHYIWQRWVPKLDSLKEGPLFEATISWKNVREQLDLQRKLEEMRITDDHLRHLQQSSEKVLAMNHVDDVLPRLQRLFWKPEMYYNKYSRSCRLGDGNDSNNESLVITWGPETGGLTGNQVTEGDSAQISLLPGFKYHVRVASNDGPGSFPIVVDTRHIVNLSAVIDSSPSPLSSASSSTSPPSSVCDFTCYVKLFSQSGWEYVVVLFVVTFIVYCYILVDACFLKKPTWQADIKA